jgi:hypothetical protein
LGKFHNILKRLPYKPVDILNGFEDIAIRSKPGEKGKSFARMEWSSKEQTIHGSTDVVTWALLEDIEKVKEE